MRKIISKFLVGIVLMMTLGSSFVDIAYADTSVSNQTTPSGISLTELEQTIDAYSEQYVGKTVPGASVAIVKDGQIIFSKGYGYADIEKSIAVTSDTTVQEWGSVTKLFTWTALMQLAERDEIDLDETIKTYLPEAFTKQLKLKQEVTIRNLMNHSAGFGEYGFDLIVDTPEEVVSLEEGILLSHPNQYYEVGKGSAYSNHATAIAGYIIENVTGLTYDAYLDQNFYKPLNMEMTSASPTFDVSDVIRNNKAKGYTPVGEGIFEEAFWSYVHLSPAGSLNGTAEDLAQFAIALMPTKEIQSPLFKKNETLELLWTPTTLQTANGFFIFNGEKRAFGHGGNTAGFTAQFAVVPEEGFGVVILTNVAGELEYALGLQEMLIGKKTFEFEKSDDQLPNATAVEGSYISLRRTVGSFLDVTSFLSTTKILKTSENEIIVEFAGYKGDYIQTAPYYYEIKNSKNPLFNAIYPVLDFYVQNGKVTHINVGHGFDMTPIPINRSLPVQLLSLTVIIWGALFFTIRIIALAIAHLKTKKNGTHDKSSRKYGVPVAALGIMIIGNNILCLVRFMSNSFRSFSEMQAHIVLNYIGVAILAVLLRQVVKTAKDEECSKWQRVFRGMDFSALMSVFIVIWHWNFFVLY